MTLKQSDGPAPFYLLVAGTLLLCNEPAMAEEALQFNVIQNSEQQRHISMIPGEGYTRDGKIRESHNPNSIVHQYEQMLRNLRREYRELSMTRDSGITEESGLPESVSVKAIQAPSPAGNSLDRKNEITDLEDLIELEKRVGRETTKPGQ